MGKRQEGLLRPDAIRITSVMVRCSNCETEFTVDQQVLGKGEMGAAGAQVYNEFHCPKCGSGVALHLSWS